MELRDYQRRAVNDVIRLWHGGTANICLVAPTGSGKSVMAAEVVRRARAGGHRVVAVAHRRELIGQLLEHFGGEAAAICPGFEPRDDAPIQVATVQSLLARDRRPQAELMIWDECHHVPSDEWQQVLSAYDDVRCLGMTATPQRSDGRPLGDMYDDLVVAAQYSELVKAGHLVPCRVWQPPGKLDGLAQTPLESYKKYTDGKQAFCFCRDVAQAYEVCQSFNDAGVPAAVIEGNTKLDERKRSLDNFRQGKLSVLVNVYVLTEGIDVPAAEVCILARGPRHASTYLQMVGRVLRPSEGKTEAVVLDLPGVTHVHGLPTDDRHYSLDGRTLSVKREGALRVCPECGWTYSGGPTCPACGYTASVEQARPRIYDAELQEVFEGRKTGIQHKIKELLRLRRLAWTRDFSVYWVVREYSKLFGEEPNKNLFSPEEKEREYNRLVHLQQERGYKRGFITMMFRKTFGHWPGR